MIRLKKIPKPKFLDSQKVQDVVKRNRALIAAGKKPVFPPLWNEPSVRKALDKRHHRGKCCYTERRRDSQLERDVEHFRPKGNVAEESHPGYWWLAYDWDNLLIVCKVNNTINKANKFPLLKGGKRAKNEQGKLEDERPVLINPALEDPSKYITFLWEETGGRFFCKPVPTTADIKEHRGRDTIEIVGIDKEELMGEEERAENGKMLKSLATRAMTAKHNMTNPAFRNRQCESFRQQFITLKEDIKLETVPERTYAGARRAFFSQRGLAECNCNEE